VTKISEQDSVSNPRKANLKNVFPLKHLHSALIGSELIFRSFIAEGNISKCIINKIYEFFIIFKVCPLNILVRLNPGNNISSGIGLKI